MRKTRPDETEPVELIEGPNNRNPRFEFPGRETMTFPPRADGKRIEWTTKEIAAQLTGAVYNRHGHPPMFRLAEELRSQNLGMDERVLEIIQRNVEQVRAILFPGGPPEPEVPQVEADPLLRDDDEEPTSIDDMNKPQLLAYARGQNVDVDARWGAEKIREHIRMHEQLGT